MPDVPKIVIERLRAAAPAVDHPDADVLTAFAEQCLPARERELVLDHVARCSDCREILALALPPAVSVPSESTIPVRSGWLTWPALRWGLAAAGLVLITSLGILQYRWSTAPSTVAYKSPEIAVPEDRAQSAAQAPRAQAARTSDKAVPALSSADSLSITNETVMMSKTPGREAVGAAAKRPGSGGGNFGALVSRGQLPYGPKMPTQWQQNNNNLQLQSSNNSPSASAPAPHSVAPSGATTVPTLPTTTVQVSNSAPQLDTLAQNREMRLPSKADSGALIEKAKPAPAAASSTTLLSAGPGQIGGYVVDPTGAAVSNARITVTSSGTGLTASAVTNAEGAWLIAGLPTGEYKAQAEAQGFRTTVADLNYDSSRPSTYRFTLNVGSVAETVAVSAQEGQLSADIATIGNTGAKPEMNPVPLNGRNLTDLTVLSNSPRWTITSSGALQRSLDQGHTWQTVDVNASAAAASSVELTADVSAANQAASRQKSTDRKVSKKGVSAPSFRAVAAAGAEVWAGGSGAALYHSLDAGSSWVRVQPSSGGSVLAGDIVSLNFPDSQHVKVTTSTSEVWTTSDAGQTWQKQ